MSEAIEVEPLDLLAKPPVIWQESRKHTGTSFNAAEPGCGGGTGRWRLGSQALPVQPGVENHLRGRWLALLGPQAQPMSLEEKKEQFNKKKDGRVQTFLGKLTSGQRECMWGRFKKG